MKKPMTIRVHESTRKHLDTELVEHYLKTFIIDNKKMICPQCGKPWKVKQDPKSQFSLRMDPNVMKMIQKRHNPGKWAAAVVDLMEGRCPLCQNKRQPLSVE